MRGAHGVLREPSRARALPEADADELKDGRAKMRGQEVKSATAARP
jgi:hypothetical protein